MATFSTANRSTATVTAPFTAALVTNGSWTAPARVVNSGAIQATPGCAQIDSNTGVIAFGLNYSGVGGFTAGSTAKAIRNFQLTYPIHT